MAKNGKKRILVIAAHPDDEVLGLGGTIALHNMRNDEVHVLILTEGCSTQYKNDEAIIAQKREEAIAANKTLGTSNLYFADLPDMRLDSLLHVELNEIIMNHINEIGPETVYTHFPDVNKDHALAYESTLVAVRPVADSPVKEVLLYETCSATEWSPPLSNTFSPNTFIDIEKTISLKIQAFQCYATEQREYPHPRSPEAIETYAKRAGIAVGVFYAESFILLRRISSLAPEI